MASILSRPQCVKHAQIIPETRKLYLAETYINSMHCFPFWQISRCDMMEWLFHPWCIDNVMDFWPVNIINMSYIKKWIGRNIKFSLRYCWGATSYRYWHWIVHNSVRNGIYWSVSVAKRPCSVDSSCWHNRHNINQVYQTKMEHNIYLTKVFMTGIRVTI